MELFPKDYILELNTKNLGNSPRFLIITHMTLSAKRFRSYGFSISSLGLAETPKVLNTVSVDNSLIFPMVH
jgi:hypothetical protein